MAGGEQNFFKGKRITMMGLGLLGRGVGDAAFLAECGAKVLVTDKKSAKELAPSVKKLKKYPNVRFALGGHELAHRVIDAMQLSRPALAGVPDPHAVGLEKVRRAQYLNQLVPSN